MKGYIKTQIFIFETLFKKKWRIFSFQYIKKKLLLKEMFLFFKMLFINKFLLYIINCLPKKHFLPKDVATLHLFC